MLSGDFAMASRSGAAPRLPTCRCRAQCSAVGIFTNGIGADLHRRVRRRSAAACSSDLQVAEPAALVVNAPPARLVARCHGVTSTSTSELPLSPYLIVVSPSTSDVSRSPVALSAASSRQARSRPANAQPAPCRSRVALPGRSAQIGDRLGGRETAHAKDRHHAPRMFRARIERFCPRAAPSSRSERPAERRSSADSGCPDATTRMSCHTGTASAAPSDQPDAALNRTPGATYAHLAAARLLDLAADPLPALPFAGQLDERIPASNARARGARRARRHGDGSASGMRAAAPVRSDATERSRPAAGRRAAYAARPCSRIDRARSRSAAPRPSSPMPKRRRSGPSSASRLMLGL